MIRWSVDRVQLGRHLRAAVFTVRPTEPVGVLEVEGALGLVAEGHRRRSPTMSGTWSHQIATRFARRLSRAVPRA